MLLVFDDEDTLVLYQALRNVIDEMTDYLRPGLYEDGEWASQDRLETLRGIIAYMENKDEEYKLVGFYEDQL
jgi:hypothetical protein